MELAPLTALSPLDGRYQSPMNPLRQHLSEYGLIYYRLLVEVRWLQFLLKQPEINSKPLDKESQHFLENILDEFSLDEAREVKQIEKKTNHDVKAIEYFLQQKLKNHPVLKQWIPWIHFGCTSEDINNTAYALMVQKTRQEILLPAMQSIIDKLKHMAKDSAGFAMLSRTHGQPASPTTMGKELMNFVSRLNTQLKKFAKLSVKAKFNGAVGNFNAHRVAYPNLPWPEIGKQFIESLGLKWNAYTTQIEPHDNLVEILQSVLRFNTVLISLNRDVWGYISLGYFSQQKIADEVGSSTMPHKVNPIDFENSEGNLGLANALIQHFAEKLPISRWQRDLTDSTVLRNLGVVFGYSFLAYQNHLRGLNKLATNAKHLLNDLNQHWEVLAEAIQTVMRRYQIADAYEQLKDYTRGKTLSAELIQSFITQLTIPEAAKKELLLLTPEKYLGYATELAAGTFEY